MTIVRKLSHDLWDGYQSGIEFLTGLFDPLWDGIDGLVWRL